MQIKVYDVKNQKKEIRAEIGMLQKRLFCCRNCEIRLRSIFLRQGYLRMSQQSDLPESMAWRVIRLECGQTQWCRGRCWSRQKCCCKAVESIARNRNVRRRPGAGRPRATTSTDGQYIQLTARRNRTEMLRNSCSWQQDEGCPAKQYVKMRDVYARRPMVCIPLTPRHRAARRRWTAEHRDWEQHDWSQVLFTDESRFSLECDTRRVIVWRDRGTQK
ncbi:HTH_Tnp_Tc3_2 domain-containing protein [Trichonephila clavipes]|nr:HTH_Tnp_Tc3_2 domain-containing protein [Trichonephila clavipes]